MSTAIHPGERPSATPEQDRAATVPSAAATVQVSASFSTGVPEPARWNDLVLRSGGTVYQTYEWLSAWWEAFGRGGDLRILTVMIAGEPAGIVPLFSRRGRRGTLMLVGSGEAFSAAPGWFFDDGPGDYLDAIIPPEGGDAAGRAIADHLREAEPGLERIDLVNLRNEGAAMRHLVPALRGDGAFEVALHPGDVCHRMELGPPAGEFVRGLDAGRRRRYGQALRLLSGDGDGPTVRTADPGSFDRMFDDLVRLHQSRWMRAGFTGLFHDERNAAFQRRVARLFDAHGWLWFSSLYEGERCLAARLGFVFGGRIYDYLSGFDETSGWAKRRPGMALLLKMYDDGLRAGLNTLDLLRGGEGYKDELTGIRERLVNMTAVRRGARSGLSARLRRARAAGAYLAGRERRLLSVQIGTHGAMKGAIRYLTFRWSRLAGKLRRGTTSHG